MTGFVTWSKNRLDIHVFKTTTINQLHKMKLPICYTSIYFKRNEK